MALIIDGKKIANDIKNELISEVQKLYRAKNIRPKLALLLIGEDAASQSYVRSKEKLCSEIGIISLVFRKSENISEKEVLKIIAEWNADASIHGILVQLPLPKHINKTKITLSIHPSKDVDGLHPENVGRLVIGLPTYVPCTPLGIYELLKRYKIETKGKHCVVVGRSNIVGKPMANLLYQKNPNADSIVTLCHTAATPMSYYTKQADIIIAAAGVPNLIKSDDVKEGVVVFDVGINRVPDTMTETGSKIVGDVDFEEVSKKASAITPVPGGVGQMTVAMLMLNTIRSAKNEIYL